MESKELLKEKVREILSGIDCCYQVEGGWWRAPGKASFGRDKLCEVIEAIDSIVIDNAIEEGWDYLPALSTIDTERSTTMADSSLNATEIAVGSLLAGNRGGGYGGYGGAWGGSTGFDHRGVLFGDPSANAVRIDRNSERVMDQNDHNRDLIDRNAKELDIQSDRMRESSDYNHASIRDQFDAAQSSREFNRLCDAINRTAKDGADQRFQSELRTNDRLLALQAEINENARVSAQCCCDLKLQMCEDKAQVLSAIAAVEGRGIERALNASQARVTQLETINAITQACGCCPGTNGTGLRA